MRMTKKKNSNSDAVYTSRAFTFSNLLPKPVNSSIITSYVNNEVCDSQLIDLEVSNSIQLRDINDESKVDDLLNFFIIFLYTSKIYHKYQL
ncbi:unnamed protein product [Rhizophagus irregularis]|nr:unnamed protein product [Rhizophagus irregularis]